MNLRIINHGHLSITIHEPTARPRPLGADLDSACINLDVDTTRLDEGLARARARLEAFAALAADLNDLEIDVVKVEPDPPGPADDFVTLDEARRAEQQQGQGG